MEFNQDFFFITSLGTCNVATVQNPAVYYYITVQMEEEKKKTPIEVHRIGIIIGIMDPAFFVPPVKVGHQ
jgi:hypothetical protein